MSDVILKHPEALRSVEIDGKTVTREQLRQMQSTAKRVELFAKIMDTYGLDVLIGLLAGGGDVASALLSGYVVVEAVRHGVGKWEVAKMVGRLGMDVAIGLVPFIGDLADYFYKANKANARAFRHHVEQVESHFPTEVIEEAEKRVVVAVERDKVKEALVG